MRRYKDQLGPMVDKRLFVGEFQYCETAWDAEVPATGTSEPWFNSGPKTATEKIQHIVADKFSWFGQRLDSTVTSIVEKIEIVKGLKEKLGEQCIMLGRLIRQSSTFGRHLRVVSSFSQVKVQFQPRLSRE
jgi:hypothetical protein